MANAYYTNQYISTTLASVGGIDDSATTGIILASVTNITTDKPGIACLSYTDPIDTSKAEWITYTSIDSGTKELQGVTRGQEDFSAKVHANGVTVSFPLSKSHINNLNDALIIDGAETNLVTGVISPTGTSSDADTELVTKSYADGGLVNSMARQAIINGNFDVWQRGTTVTNPTNATFLADRWQISFTADGGTLPTNIVHSRQLLTSGDISNAFYYYRIAPDGAGSSYGDGAQYQFRQKIEHGTRLLCGNGKKVTVSFWARSSIANKQLGIIGLQHYGTGGSPSTFETLSGSQITLTSTWTKYTVTLTTNTLSGKTFGTDNNDSFYLTFANIWGSTEGSRYGLTGTESFVGSGTIDIAQVQLCAGDVALPFMPKSFEEELRACQRYCFVPNLRGGNSLLGLGTAHSTTVARCGLVLPVEMRGTLILTATAGDYQLYDGNGITDLSAISLVESTSRTVCWILGTVASGLTQFRPYWLISGSTTNRLMIISAEL